MSKKSSGIVRLVTLLELINFIFQQYQANIYQVKYFSGKAITSNNILELYPTYPGFVVFQIISLIATYTYIIYMVKVIVAYLKKSRQSSDKVSQIKIIDEINKR